MLLHRWRGQSLGFVVELEKTQDVQHGLSDVGTETVRVLKVNKKTKRLL